MAKMCEAAVSAPFNALTSAEAERLALLAEECGEAIQAIGKVLRHGYESRHPNGGSTNRESLQAEIAHVSVAVDLMYQAEDIARDAVSSEEDAKRQRVGRYLHHQASPQPCED